MNLEQRINEDLKAAMKAGDKVRIDALRSLRAAIIEFNKSGTQTELTPEIELKILNGAAKKRKDAIEMYKNANRPDLLEKEEAELAIIQEYLPQMMSEEEIRTIVAQKIQQVGATSMKDMGKVMGPLMKELAGRADGGVVQKIVKELLEGN
jgi:hypothetical protein